jgi:hypothetical protein
LDDPIQFLEELTLNRVRNRKRVATSARLLVARRGNEPFRSPVEARWVSIAVVFIRQNIILIARHIDNAVRQPNVVSQILLIRQISEIVGAQLEWVSPVFVFFIMLSNFLQIIFERFSSPIFSELHSEGFVVESLVLWMINCLLVSCLAE